ncbi:sigma-70 family RNA polymerase sigma factor [Demequina soli]|uniref:sigma-70 family RNA polymerase sigma factor n=1 Tax=Demequina soli TaxID=1638987 RepID=UPI000781E5B8|nr:sigma-70 family RNA polymerase sigma factor [Demequina soli]
MDLTGIFETERARLRAVATRLVGADDADDAVQEAWLRASRAGLEGIERPAAWLTTITSRVCLDMLRARRTVPSEVDETWAEPTPGPEDDAVVAAAVEEALALVLDALEPASRVAFVLHDVFAIPFDQIAATLGRSVVATRQLASRARAAVRAQAAVPAGASSPAAVVDAFQAAARAGDLARLVETLAPDVVCRADGAAAAMGAAEVLAGTDAVAHRFLGGAKAAFPATIDGAPGMVWLHRGTVAVAFEFTVVDGRVAAIDLLGDPDVLAAADIVRG